MSDKKPEPLIPRRTPNRCPVCGESTYSAGGIHPQCSVRQSDAKRMERIKSESNDLKSSTPKKSTSKWQKSCPKCKAQQHVRKKVCDCGHSFGN